MANYNLYNNVEPSSITSATASLRTKVETAQSSLSTFKGSLTDSVWKATAKQTLFDAFDKIDSEVCADILKYLGVADEIAGHVTEYKTARTNAQNAKSSRDSLADTPQNASRRSELAADITKYEGEMDKAEQAVKALL